MKKKITGVILIAVMAVSGLAACGVKKEDASALQQNSSVVSTVNLESMEDSEDTISQTAPQTIDEMEETPVMDELPEDRSMISVSGDIKEFAESIQAAVEAEDMEALADMSYYPLYVSFGEGEGRNWNPGKTLWLWTVAGYLQRN